LNDAHNAVFLIVDTLIEPLPVVFHDPAGHFGRNGSNFLGYRLLKSSQRLGMMLIYLGFEVAPEKKSHGVKSGERGSHPMSPHKETTCPGNISLRIPGKQRDVWAVAPTCLNHTFSAPCSSKRSFQLSQRKVFSIAQYRSEVTITVTPSYSKRYRPHTPNSKMAHHLRAVEWPVVKFPRVIVSPVPEILFIECA
jgi:hypothetical protein